MKKRLFIWYGNFYAWAIKAFKGSGLSRLPVVRAAHKFFYYSLKPSTVVVNGFTVYIDPADHIISERLIKNREWEEYEGEILKQEVKKGSVVLNIGANIGYHTLLISRLVGDKGRVYAFEPDPNNFALLKKNVLVNHCDNVVLEQKAVTDVNKQLSLYLCEENKGDHRVYNSDNNRKSVPVTGICLDDYFKNYEGKIDIIVMDIQGSEGYCLQGMLALLKKNPQAVLITEFWPAGLLKSGYGAAKFLQDLYGKFANVYEIDETVKSTPKVTAKELLEKYPVENEPYTNLICKNN